MANRFNAIGYSTKHLDDDDHFHFGYAIIKPADQTLTELEFEFGARVLVYDVPSMDKLHSYLVNQYYEVVDIERWQQLITPKDFVTNNNWLYPTKPDKWDTRPEIY